jgi:hypothetical protein
MAVFAFDADDALRCAAAGAQDTPIEVLTLLAGDPAKPVREAVLVGIERLGIELTRVGRLSTRRRFQGGWWAINLQPAAIEELVSTLWANTRMRVSWRTPSSSSADPETQR